MTFHSAPSLYTASQDAINANPVTAIAVVLVAIVITLKWLG